MSRLKRLIHEIHRRSLWQVLSVYLISSWIALQVADTVTAALGLPDWVPQAALVLLIVLLPVVLATAFVQEGVGGARLEPVAEAEKAEGEPTPEVAAPEPRGAHHRVFTWRNAIAATVVMLALLTVSAGGYMGLRAAGIGPFGTLVTKGVLSEGERIVIAEFEDSAGDSALAQTVTSAFRIDLSSSPTVNVMSEGAVANVLELMMRPRGMRLDERPARAMALREGIKAIVTGEVGIAGSTYIISAQLVSSDTEEIVWAGRETATDAGAIIPAVDRLSRALRERIGESLSSIRAVRVYPAL